MQFCCARQCRWFQHRVLVRVPWIDRLCHRSWLCALLRINARGKWHVEHFATVADISWYIFQLSKLWFFYFGENLNCELIVNHQWAQSNISIILRANDFCNVRHVLGKNHGATCLCPFTITGVMWMGEWEAFVKCLRDSPYNWSSEGGGDSHAIPSKVGKMLDRLLYSP